MANGMRTSFEQSGGYVRNAEPLWSGQDAVIQVRGTRFHPNLIPLIALR